jgi:hypothetical protein
MIDGKRIRINQIRAMGRRIEFSMYVYNFKVPTPTMTLRIAHCCNTGCLPCRSKRKTDENSKLSILDVYIMLCVQVLSYIIVNSLFLSITSFPSVERSTFCMDRNVMHYLFCATLGNIVTYFPFSNERS